MDKRSTPSYYTLLGGNIVTWRNKKKTGMARSSAKTESHMEFCEFLWLKIIRKDLIIKWQGPMNSIVITSLLSIAHNSGPNYQTKHVEVDIHFIKEKLDGGPICTPYVSTNGQFANILTKRLLNPTFQAIRSKLGMGDIY